MSCTKSMFGLKLKKQLLQKKSLLEIAQWSYLNYSECCVETDKGLLQLMLDLTTMELGDQFEISYNMLHKIADDLMADKDVDLNSVEYREKPGSEFVQSKKMIGKVKSCTKPMIGIELKRQLLQKKEIKEISEWAKSIYFECHEKVDTDLSRLIQDLTLLELGNQFEIPYKILHKIADDLMADKNVDLNLAEYGKIFD